MPIFDYHCKDCDREFESIEVWESMKAEECVHCHSKNIERQIATKTHIRMNSDTILRSLPDPTPPLEELRGKTKPGCVGGYEDKPYADTDINHYDMSHDKYGNRIFTEKKKLYFDQGGENKE